jgi:hypothetical protein
MQSVRSTLFLSAIKKIVCAIPDDSVNMESMEYAGDENASPFIPE